MSSKDTLAEYRSKRSRSGSAEPAGDSPASGGDGGRFVIQRHDASSLHFDVRLEIAGVLVSWAVPKGPSTDPRQKRLATRTEDHPLDYATFEGRIPAGDYGGGTVVVWDTGTFANDGDHDTQTALDRGHLRVRLDGHKLSGAYAFIHSRMRGDDSNWLMVKVDDGGADRRRNPATTQLESVLPGRRNEDL